jgi:hypothetical protein
VLKPRHRADGEDRPIQHVPSLGPATNPGSHRA